MSKDKFIKSIPIFISTSNSSEPTLPDVDIKNPLDAITFLNSLELLFDPAFQLKGKLHITVNDADVFTPQNTGDLRRYALFSLPMNNRQLLRQGHIKIFAWNGLADGSLITASGNAMISDSAIDLSKGSLPATLPLMSDPIILFDFKSWGVGTTNYKQFDLLGYKKMIVLIAATGYVAPSLLSRVSNGWNLTNVGEDLDSNLTTFLGLGVNSGQLPADFVSVYDFGSSLTRQIALDWSQTQGGGNSGTVTLEVSTDNLNWTTVYSQNFANAFAEIAFIDIQRNFRYVRLTCHVATNVNGVSINIFEIYDAMAFGGTANVSFEVFDTASSSWINLIPASEIGTISNGQSISRQIGDVISRSGGSVGYILPSNFSSFRARLDMLGSKGGLFTGVSIIRVA